MSSYLRFAAMIATSTVVMFILMYLNTYAWEHVFWSETRVYMAILMGACMAVIMLAYMLGMYEDMRINIGIFAGAVLLGLLALWLVRSQATVSGVSYMRAMTPHHSIAILTSERAQIADPRVRKLAEEIAEAQRREIAEMRYLSADLEGENGDIRPDIYEDGPPETGTIADALSRTLVAELDPAPVTPAEADRVLTPGPGCSFAWTRQSEPILVARAPAGDAGAVRGLMKLNGILVPLEAAGTGAAGSLREGAVLTAEGVRMSVRRFSGDSALQRSNADLVFELDRGLSVGYRGFYTCDG